MKVFAHYLPLNKSVKVTLRKPVLDLTDKNLNVASYIHNGKATVSGRLTYNRVIEDYQFTPNK